MIFTTLTYLFFLLGIFAVYWFLPRRAQNLLLLVASYVFYGYWDWRFLGLIMISTLVDYACARLIVGSDTPRARKTYITISVLFNLGLLGFFKYFNFFIDSANTLLMSIGLIDVPQITLEIILPVGISFYTFQTMSYTIDVYRGQAKARKNLIDVALFVSFFPQLVAGPIERAGHLLNQLEQRRIFNGERALEGITLIAWGVFKKLVIANNLALYVEWTFESIGSDHPPLGGEMLVGIVAFAFQIYADFSAYSDIARGSARLLGIDLMRNFNMPYLALSYREFWHRWHISLSTWMRDYVYLPLGGSRCAPWRRDVNLMLTMLISGLWHGAAWTFVVWGVLHGIYLLLERHVAGLYSKLSTPRSIDFMLMPVRWSLVMAGVLLGWSLFRAKTFTDAVSIWSGILQWEGLGAGKVVLWQIGVYSSILLLTYIATWLLRKRQLPASMKVLGYTLAAPVFVIATLLFSQPGEPEFIYFQF